MLIDFLLGMGFVVIYKSYYELKELVQPEIIIIDNKGFCEIKYIQKAISAKDILNYIVNNNLIRLY